MNSIRNFLSGSKCRILCTGTAISGILIFTSCLNSLSPRSSDAGSNLGFEYGKRGLPSNWILYDPKGIEQKISLDSIHFKEGKQSLKFDILKAQEGGDLGLAGFTNEFMEETRGGGKYRLTFWVKNHGTRFRIFAGGVKAKETDAKAVIREESGYITDWQKFEIDTDIPSDMWLRFEIRLKGKGSFWIDGVEITRLN